MTEDIAARADRHMRPDPQGILASADHATQGRIRIVVQPSVAGTYAGQHAAWMMANLLARQFGLVASIEIDVPEVELLPGVVAFGTASSLASSMRECIGMIGDSYVAIANPDAGEIVDVELVVGLERQNALCKRRWYIHADGWRFHVGGEPCLGAPLPTSRLAFGPHLAASIATGEVFKLLRGLKEGRGAYLENLVASAWSGAMVDTWQGLEAGPSLEELTLPHAYVVGAGAVAQAAIFTLGASGLRGSLTVIDHDQLDISNSNRYVLSWSSDNGVDKVKIAERYLGGTNIRCVPAKAKWAEFTRYPRDEWLHSDLREMERKNLYSIVLSCVDKNHPRHEIQNAMPELIIGGSTDGLTARAQAFTLEGEDACLKCHNPVENVVRVAHARIEEARIGSEEHRAAFCSELGIDREELTRILDATGCGQLTPVDIERFGGGPPQMSVGFVSVAAGVLQAALLVRTQCSEPNKDTHWPVMVAAFSNGRLGTVRIKREAGCDCGNDRRGLWLRMWRS